MRQLLLLGIVGSLSVGCIGGAQPGATGQPVGEFTQAAATTGDWDAQEWVTAYLTWGQTTPLDGRYVSLSRACQRSSPDFAYAGFSQGLVQANATAEGYTSGLTTGSSTCSGYDAD